MGDDIRVGRDNIASPLGRKASLEADAVTVFQQAVDNSAIADADLKRALKEARAALEVAGLGEKDRADAADDLGKLAEEMAAPQTDAGRVNRLWTRIKEVTPTVATILSGAAALAKLLKP